ncbi:MAG: hypothetical protein WCL23_03025 [Candidatus Moraniibacteriota bacterium]
MERIPDISSLRIDTNQNRNEGYDVEVHILFGRHAEKGSHSGGLTEKGQGDAKVFGLKLKRLESIKKFNIAPATHSGHKRTARSAFLIDNPTTDLDKLGEFDKHSEEATKNILNSSVDRYSEEADKKYAELSEGNFSSESGGVEYFAQLGERRFDEDTPSSIEMSRMVSQDILDMIDATKKVPSGSKQFFPNIVHSGIFEHFLIDLLKKRGEERLLESIGGPLGFFGFDDFRMYVKRDTPSEAKIQFRFRNREEGGQMKYYDVSEGELRGLAGKID